MEGRDEEAGLYRSCRTQGQDRYPPSCSHYRQPRALALTPPPSDEGLLWKDTKAMFFKIRLQVGSQGQGHLETKRASALIHFLPARGIAEHQPGSVGGRQFAQDDSQALPRASTPEAGENLVQHHAGRSGERCADERVANMKTTGGEQLTLKLRRPLTAASWGDAARSPEARRAIKTRRQAIKRKLDPRTHTLTTKERNALRTELDLLALCRKSVLRCCT